MTKYKASNQNLPPVPSGQWNWASIVETMVSTGLLFSLVTYLLFPAMIGGHVFQLVTSATLATPDAGGVATITIHSADLKGLLWLCAFAAQLASVAMLVTVVIWALPVKKFPNVSFLAKSFVLALIASGDFVRSSALQLPEGATIPVLPMSGLVDLPAIANEGMIAGFAHNCLAPFLIVAVVGIGVGFYRMGAARLARKLASVRPLAKTS
ncbi:hypothetical protein [Rhizobium leguminosarum]|uniref:hypothetical protein n=1 Tax=Rhizobium leguminosarum TaxID=384 RepID=UPI002E1013C4|nr:hypothetical protein U8Q02_39040 [Rhizobium leguminosarum]